MKKLGLSKYRIQTKVFLILLSVTALLASVLSIVFAARLSGSALISLAAAATVSAFIGRFQIRLPKSNVILPVANLFAFWGMIWFGLAGGISLGIIASLFSFWPVRKERGHDLFTASCGVIATAASVGALALIIGFGPLAGDLSSGLEPYAVKLLFGGTAVVAIAYVGVSNALIFLFRLLESEEQTPELSLARLGQRSIAVLLVGSATILVCLPFFQFGIEFGLVFAPLAIFANLAYSVHLKRLDQTTKQVSDSSRIHLATVEALATAIDARDQVGMGHVRRAQIYAIGIGELLGLPDDEIKALRTGALLHDIGKLAIPDHILSKPGKLTAAEIEKTKIHASVGASILENIDFGYPVVSTIKYHHECWDGSGYPEGLRGEEIPLTARILSVADAYDTLRGARPYRPALTRENARQIIQEWAGTRLDPTIVRYFIKNLAQLEAEIDLQKLSYSGDEPVNIVNTASSQGYVEQIKLANREVFTLYELAREFSSSFDLQETLGLFTKKIGEFVPFITCAVFLLDENKKFATATHVDGENSTVLTARRIKIGQGATGIALKSRETVQNVDPDLDFSFSHVELSQYYSTMASVPLIADEELIGAVSIYSREMASYGEEHLRLLETIARIAAEAISKTLKHDEVKAHALTDTMTGLPNARSLQIQFEKEVGRASRAGNSFQLLMLDLDGFKAVNDSFGHKIGDDVLNEIGKVIRGQLRDYDFLSRYGGDEFVALIPETSREDVLDLCNRIEKAVGEFKLMVEDGKFASVGVSLGSSSYPVHGETFNQMIVAADKAMYERKSRRKMINPAKPIKPKAVQIEDTAYDRSNLADNDNFIVELDETHVVSGAIN